MTITEAQSRSLHNALIASFDQFVAPIVNTCKKELSMDASALEKKVKEFCIRELGWEIRSTGYPVIYDPDQGTITISPEDEELGLDELNKLASLGTGIRVSSSGYTMTVSINVYSGINVI